MDLNVGDIHGEPPKGFHNVSGFLSKVYPPENGERGQKQSIVLEGEGQKIRVYLTKDFVGQEMEGRHVTVTGVSVRRSAQGNTYASGGKFTKVEAPDAGGMSRPEAKQAVQQAKAQFNNDERSDIITFQNARSQAADVIAAYVSAFKGLPDQGWVEEAAHLITLCASHIEGRRDSGIKHGRALCETGSTAARDAVDEEVGF